MPLTIYSELPESYLKEVLNYEGGYANDPVDRGGETNRGITIGALNKAKSQGLVSQSVTIKSLTADLESVRRIYSVNYYKAGKCDQMPHPLAFACFDACVNHGLGGGGQLLQKTLVSLGFPVAVDGAVGPKTLAALSSCLGKFTAIRIAEMYNDKREARYLGIVSSNPSQKKFLKGWLNRLAGVRRFAAKG
jgi:lysozyme family protein